MYMYPIASPYFERQNHDPTLKVNVKLEWLHFMHISSNILLVRQRYISLVVNALRKQRHSLAGIVNDPTSF